MNPNHADVGPVIVRTDSLFDGETYRRAPRIEILVDGGRILDVGEFVPTPDGARILDLTGSTVSPGFIDTHVHVELTADRLVGVYHHESSALKALHALPGMAHLLQTGFTTVRDCGGLDDDWGTVALREAVDRGLVSGPRLIVAPHILGGTGGHAEAPERAPAHRAVATGIADGVSAVRARVREEIMGGADWVKVALSGFFGFRRGDGALDLAWSQEELDACVEAAADLGTDVAVHALDDRGIARALRAGARSIEHASLAGDEAIASLEQSDAFVVPTMRVIRDLFNGVMTDVTDPSAHASAPPVAGIFLMRDQLLASQERIARSAVRIAFGSDGGGYPPLDSAQEFLALTQFGVSNERALRAATSVAADLLRRPDLGRIRPGATADIIALDGNPLDDIHATGRVRFVMKQGHIARDDVIRRAAPAGAPE